MSDLACPLKAMALLPRPRGVERMSDDEVRRATRCDDGCAWFDADSKECAVLELCYAVRGIRRAASSAAYVVCRGGVTSSSGDSGESGR
jgi:hypothetical protein